MNDTEGLEHTTWIPIENIGKIAGAIASGGLYGGVVASMEGLLTLRIFSSGENIAGAAVEGAFAGGVNYAFGIWKYRRNRARNKWVCRSPEQSRNARTREADQECLQLLVIRFHKLWKWKFTLQMNLLFQINTRQLFCPFGYSSVVSSTAWYVLLRYALCGKTVLERLQFRYFSGLSSHPQAYLAVVSDSDGLSAFKFLVGL